MLGILPNQAKAPQAVPGSIQMGQEAIVSQAAFEFEGASTEDGGGRGNELVECVSDGRDVVLDSKLVRKSSHCSDL